jgi:hypothetical protein
MRVRVCEFAQGACAEREMNNGRVPRRHSPSPMQMLAAISISSAVSSAANQRCSLNILACASSSVVRDVSTLGAGDRLLLGFHGLSKETKETRAARSKEGMKPARSECRLLAAFSY